MNPPTLMWEDSYMFYIKFFYLAYATERVSRITVILTCPG